MQRLGGKEVADKIVEDLRIKVGELKSRGISPKLAILRVGERDDDLAYERGVLKRFESAGVEVEITALDAGVSQEELDETFDGINNDPKVHGILVFRPLPKPLSDEHMRKTIDSGKDSDFMDIRNMENVLAGVPDSAAPCTAEAVMALIRHYGIETKGKKVTVVGRSLVIGKPAALLLTTANATVTVCHTKTVNIEEECKNADIIVACCGVAKMITDKFVKPGQIVIDVGMNVDEEGRLCGDVDYEKVSEIAEAVTPVPGGVGSITTAILLKHVVDNAAS
ncbi:MAG: bifunctional 5,10-methylenetetrahydrofolate dehydrogenase/5,10-methenyltetrahydrofolate cyclohydrolase [Clostridiales bacterium]|nr:bifunctional 5,10-methylenetetrahydrofolate dehydrogenase/5,10-methenyltetrahydrofolate cyclohydrolase [Clostridiales bacterium]MBR4948653.1 bifunctional 5,10-methylenetetrahydrofolate dehydrogenase/5,10-methenyltetrahydrofolate cyclohydrolase [Clostridiales bacterium]